MNKTTVDKIIKILDTIDQGCKKYNVLMLSLVIIVTFIMGIFCGTLLSPKPIQKEQIESKIERLIVISSPDKKETWQILQSSVDGTLSTSSDFTVNEIIQIKKQFDKIMPYTFYLDEKELKAMRDNLILAYPLEVKK